MDKRVIEFNSKRDIPALIAVNVQRYIESLTPGEWIIEIKRKRKKKSNNANSYMWQLCEKIAIELSKDGTFFSRDDIYREAIIAAGKYKDVPAPIKEIEDIVEQWQMQGVGWAVQEFGEGCRFYFGSSSYDKRELKRLIDYVVSEAKNLEIETETPEQIAKWVALWQSQ